MNRNTRLVTTNFSMGLDLSDRTIDALQAAADRQRAREQRIRAVQQRQPVSYQQRLETQGAK
jgi:hypothetical protein